MSPTEAQAAFTCGASEPERLAERIARGLLSGLRAALLDKSLDNYDLAMELLRTLGIRQGVLIKDLGSLTVVYIDRSLFEAQCAYSACANVQNQVEKEMCSKRCAAEMAEKVAVEISQRLCEAAKNMAQASGGRS